MAIHGKILASYLSWFSSGLYGTASGKPEKAWCEYRYFRDWGSGDLSSG